MLAGVRAGEGIVGRQDRLWIAAGEVYRAGIAGGHVSEGIPKLGGNVVRDTCGGRGGEAGQSHALGRRRHYGDSLRTSNRQGNRISAGDSPAARAEESDAIG